MGTTRLCKSYMVLEWLRVMCYLNMNKERRRSHMHLLITCSCQLQERRLKYNMKIIEELLSVDFF